MCVRIERIARLSYSSGNIGSVSVKRKRWKELEREKKRILSLHTYRLHALREHVHAHGVAGGGLEAQVHRMARNRTLR